MFAALAVAESPRIEQFGSPNVMPLLAPLANTLPPDTSSFVAGLLVPMPKFVPVQTRLDPVAKALVLVAYATPFVVNAELEPVPPLVAGNVPVTPVVKGNPVVFVNTPLEGVPNAGVVNVGEVRVNPAIVVVVLPRYVAVEPSVIAVAKLLSRLDNGIALVAVANVYGTAMLEPHS